ncbi:unnamed protein product [Didymodactylos carnosus]|uniref:Uncharacterized protein n=1 Tax=Didymodactylos carnosus TaxID=1234261 RepID=A0A814ZQU9_9BILA|nr:unnamed protein product [Didymodactylos carnosus]CAF4013795.1 unnamed protein product [Didymodactylos carnosus]
MTTRKIGTSRAYYQLGLVPILPISSQAWYQSYQSPVRLGLVPILPISSQDWYQSYQSPVRIGTNPTNLQSGLVPSLTGTNPGLISLDAEQQSDINFIIWKNP